MAQNMMEHEMGEKRKANSTYNMISILLEKL